MRRKAVQVFEGDGIRRGQPEPGFIFQVGLRRREGGDLYNDRTHETVEEAIDDMRTLVEDGATGTPPREIDKIMRACTVKVRIYLNHCREAKVAPSTNEFVINCGDGNDAVLIVRCTW